MKSIFLTVLTLTFNFSNLAFVVSTHCWLMLSCSSAVFRARISLAWREQQNYFKLVGVNYIKELLLLRHGTKKQFLRLEYYKKTLKDDWSLKMKGSYQAGMCSVQLILQASDAGLVHVLHVFHAFQIGVAIDWNKKSSNRANRVSGTNRLENEVINSYLRMETAIWATKDAQKSLKKILPRKNKTNKNTNLFVSGSSWGVTTVLPAWWPSARPPSSSSRSPPVSRQAKRNAFLRGQAEISQVYSFTVLHNIIREKLNKTGNGDFWNVSEAKPQNPSTFQHKMIIKFGIKSKLSRFCAVSGWFRYNPHKTNNPYTDTESQCN